jgi:hypothetical protein
MTPISLQKWLKLTRAVETVSMEFEVSSRCGCHLLRAVEEMLRVWNSCETQLESRIKDAEKVLRVIDDNLPRFFEGGPRTCRVLRAGYTQLPNKVGRKNGRSGRG